MNKHVAYANQYKCTIAQSIGDRDWPMNLSECIAEFVEAAGRQPTQNELQDMRPDQQHHVSECRAEFDAAYASY